MSYSNEIVLAEGDPHYAFMVQLAFHKAGIQNPIHVLVSQDQVIDYMAGVGPYGDRDRYPFPGAIILAVRLPLLEDFKALRWIRRHPRFHSIGIVVLSGLEYDNERAIAYEAGADWYRVKPIDFAELVNIAQQIGQRWLASSDEQAVA